MNQIIQTVFNSLQDLVGSSVKIIPAILIALIIILLTLHRRIYAKFGRPNR